MHCDFMRSPGRRRTNRRRLFPNISSFNSSVNKIFSQSFSVQSWYFLAHWSLFFLLITLSLFLCSYVSIEILSCQTPSHCWLTHWCFSGCIEFCGQIKDGFNLLRLLITSKNFSLRCDVFLGAPERGRSSYEPVSLYRWMVLATPVTENFNFFEICRISISFFSQSNDFDSRFIRNLARWSHFQWLWYFITFTKTTEIQLHSNDLLSL